MLTIHGARLLAVGFSKAASGLRIDTLNPLEGTSEALLKPITFHMFVAARNTSGGRKAGLIGSCGRSLSTTGRSPGIERLDSYLVNWSLNLPPSKRHFDINGDFDEMLFQAQMITNV